MALAIVQHKSAVQGLAVPGTITLASTPTAGNLLILFLHCNLASASITVNTAKWTLDTAATVTTSTFGQCLYRYVQGGDTTTVPAPWTAGSSYTAYEIYEVSGVSGTFATDHEDTQALAHDAGTPTTTLSVSHTTVHASALLLTGAGQYNGSHNPTFNSGWTADETSNNNLNYGSQASSNQAVASATAITSTVTYGGSSQPADLFMVTLKPSSNTETGTGTLTFGGMAMAGAGGRTETSTGTLAFSGIRFTASGRASHTGSGALHFGALSIHASGTDLAAPQPQPVPLTVPTPPRVDPLKWDVPMVDRNGLPTTEFQRKWQQQKSANSDIVGQSYIDGQDAAGLASSQRYTVDYGASVLTSAKTYTDNAVAGLGTGSVTSVTVTMPAELTPTGNPITTSGTIAFTWATELANKVFAGPTTGAAAMPGFRSLVAADIPDISATYETVSAASATYLPLTGGTMSGRIKAADGAAATPSVYWDTNSGFWNDTTNSGIGISVGGSQVGWFAAGGPVYQVTGGGVILMLQSEAGTQIITARYSNDVNAPAQIQRKARGTIASPTVPLTSDLSANFAGQLWTGAAFANAGQMQFVTTETTVGPTALGTRWLLKMAAVGGSSTPEVLRAENETGLSMFGPNPVIDQNRVIRPRAYTVGTVPTVTATGLIEVTDEGGGRALCTTFGTAWRRTSDNQVISSTGPSARGLLSLMDTRVSWSNQDIVHHTFQKLSDAGLLTKLLGLWVFAGAPASSTDALRNWATLGTRDLAIVGSPTWSQTGGFTGDGSTALLNTAATISAFGASQNSYTVGCYVLAGSASAAAVIGQNSSALTRTNYMQSATSGSLVTGCVAATTAAAFTPTYYTGMFTMSRTGSTNYNDSLDDLAATTVTKTSIAATNRIPSFLGTVDTTASEFSTAQVAFAFIGNGLTATDLANLRAAMVDYYLVQTKVLSSTYLVGRLPGATAAYEGQRLMVSDATVTASGNFGATLTGGSTNHVPAYYESGTPAWRIG